MPPGPDRDEFLRLLDDHGAVVLAMLRRLCGNSPDAEDAFQETAVRVWRSFHTRPWLRNPRSWLMTIAYRTFIDLHARRRPCDELCEVPDQRSQRPDHHAQRREEAQCLGSAVEWLSPTLREVVLLHYTGGLTLSETAQALGVSQGTVKSRLNAALAKLRSVLE